MEFAVKKIDKLGRIVLPMDYRKALGLVGECEVLLGISGDTITVRALKASCRLCGCGSVVSESLMVCADCIRNIKKIKTIE